jgi:hypothetical protein
MTISVPILLILLLAHWFADFVMQNDEMAINKSSSNQALMSHIGAYTCMMFFAVGFLLGFNNVSLLLGLVFLFVNAAAHFVTDYVTSRITSKQWKAGDRHGFFVTIGFDQFLHVAVLVLSWVFIIGV